MDPLIPYEEDPASSISPEPSDKFREDQIIVVV
jgi:hypothetical protein